MRYLGSAGGRSNGQDKDRIVRITVPESPGPLAPSAAAASLQRRWPDRLKSCQDRDSRPVFSCSVLQGTYRSCKTPCWSSSVRNFCRRYIVLDVPVLNRFLNRLLLDAACFRVRCYRLSLLPPAEYSVVCLRVQHWCLGSGLLAPPCILKNERQVSVFTGVQVRGVQLGNRRLWSLEGR